MSHRVQWHSFPYHPSWALKVYSSCELSKPSCCSWAMIAIGRSMGRIYPGQSASRTGDHWSSSFALCGGSALQGQCSGVPMWSLALHCAHWPWGFPGHPQPLFCSGVPWAIKQSEMTVTCAGFGDSQAKASCESRLAAASAGPAAHWGQLLLVW